MAVGMWEYKLAEQYYNIVANKQLRVATILRLAALRLSVTRCIERINLKPSSKLTSRLFNCMWAMMWPTCRGWVSDSVWELGRR